MSKTICSFIIIYFIITGLCSAQSVTTLTFTGKSSITQEHIPLHHVVINNVTQHWEEILFYPDTVLSFGGTGVEEYDKPNSVRLLQNVPNPFNGVTNFQLELPNGANVTIEIYNLNGQRISFFSDNLESGIHLFRATLTAPQTYLASAQADGARVTIKLINQGYGEKNSLEHLGCVQTKEDLILPIQDTKGNTPLPFMLGDEMRYVGYVYRNGIEYSSQPVQQREWGSNAITLLFGAFHPTVTTDSAYSVTQTAVQVDGNVVSDGDATVTARGFCWGMNHNPTLEDNYSNNGTGLGSFSNFISGLADNTTYYVRAYATNSVGTTYGNEIQFTTLPYTVPTVSTDSVTDIAQTTAICYGNVSYAGGHPVTEKGFCWSTNPHPTLNDEHITAGSGLGGFSGSHTGLTVETTYYVRAYATNSIGTAYGNEVSFTTLPAIIPPVVTTLAVTDVTSVSATCGGDITYDGGGSVTMRGVCWSTLHNPTFADNHTTDGTGSGSYTSLITGLDSLTTYYVRAYATNIAGTGYGEELSFITPVRPIVITDSVSNVTWNTAVCGGNVSSDGGAAVTARGVCWSTSPNPTDSDSHTVDGSGTGSFSSSITGLTSNTTYYVRAYATNSIGTVYGNEVSFTTATSTVGQDGEPCSGIPTLTDIDGNVYNTVLIGNQCWMRENLRTTKYADGTSISQGSSTSTTVAYWYYPNNDASNKTTYGLLYNWKAVMRNSSSSSANPSGVQGICPIGWHVPSDAEWIQLTDYVGSQSQYVCGSNNTYIAKALACATGWNSTSYNECAIGNNYSLNNATGFTALSAGCYGTNPYFGFGTYFWSASEDDVEHAWRRGLYYSNALVDRYNNSKDFGLSVRCLRDEGGSTASLPTVSTTFPSNITTTTATCGGNVTNDGGATVTARGVCWSTSPNPTVNDNYTIDGSGTGCFTSSITGLMPGTTYYVRAYATNSVGTAYDANSWYFVTGTSTCPNTPTLTDRDGNTYNTVQIGSQCWMKENLRTTKYTDGTSISQGSDTSATVGYWYYPNNSPSNKTTYGLLYNWPAVMHAASSTNANPSGVQGICPMGWHVPSLAEWNQLTDYVGRQWQYLCNNFNGEIAKALADTVGWNSHSCTDTCSVGNMPSSNNATGFSALPAGTCDHYYYNFGYSANFWTSSNEIIGESLSIRFEVCSSYVNQENAYPQKSYSVRCLRDENDGCTGTATLTDRDSNVYNTVKIGAQCWMRENLRTTKYADGTPILQGNDTSSMVAYWYYPNSDSSNKTTYGLLYNWNAVMWNSSASSANPSGVQGVCPNGWHIPSDAEWTQLTDYVSSQSQYMCGGTSTYIACALAGTMGWNSGTNSCAAGAFPTANDNTGFRALPAGFYPTGHIGKYADFWSATESDGRRAYDRYLYYNTATIGRSVMDKYKGYSVRCLRDESGSTASQLPTVTTSSVTDITSSTATSGGNITSDGGATVTARGVCWSTSQNPTIADSHTIDGSGTGSFTSSLTGLTSNTTYYVRAFAINEVGTAYGNEVSFTTPPQDGQPCPNNETVTDIDGNIYNTVLIGSQCWMKENLRTTRYADSTEILVGSTTSYNEPYRYAPNNDESIVPTYGYLYNWPAMMHGACSSDANPSGVLGICPNGWHMPSDAEWTQLTDYVSSQNQYVCGGDNTFIAKSLAETTSWSSSSDTCAVGNTPSSNNTTGFSAFPAGSYYGNSGNFSTNGCFWSATDIGSYNACYRYFGYNSANVLRTGGPNNYGYSVRCVKD